MDTMNSPLNGTPAPGQGGNLPLAIEKAARVVYLMAMDGVIGIDTGAPPELARNALGLLGSLLYTGVTRGKKLVVVIAEPKALGMAARNRKAGKRVTRLAERLAAPDGRAPIA